MRDEETKNTFIRTYGDLDELVEVWKKNKRNGPSSTRKDDWATMGDDVSSLIAHGWADGVRMATPIAEQALETIETESEVTRYEADWQVSGSEVDVSRYLQGQPECMIEYQPVRISKVGKVVQLRVGVFLSNAISNRDWVKRGASVVRLAMALEECQHSVEIWLDLCVGEVHGSSGKKVIIRTLVKDAHDSLDPARLAYWLSHPSVFRRVHFAAMDALPEKWGEVVGHKGHGYGVKATPEDLPEEAIYIPQTCYSEHLSDPTQWVKDAMKKLGLV
jgi:hypothetical protein